MFDNTHPLLILMGISLALLLRFYYQLYLKPFYLKNRFSYAEYHALLGLVKRVVWRRGGTVLFLQDTDIYCPDPNGHGGSRVIWRFSDEDVCTWLPLTLQVVPIEEPALTTRENCQIALKLQLLWRINNVNQYASLFDTFIQSENNADYHNFRAYGDQVVRFITQSTLKQTFLQTTLRQLLAFCPKVTSQFADNYLAVTSGFQASGQNVHLFQQLRQHLQNEIGKICNPLGIQIIGVNLEDIRFPDEIQVSLHKYWQGVVNEKVSECQAQQDLTRLQVYNQIFGEKATALRHILSIFKHCQMTGMTPQGMNSYVRMIEDNLNRMQDQEPEQPDSRTPHRKVMN